MSRSPAPHGTPLALCRTRGELEGVVWFAGWGASTPKQRINTFPAPRSALCRMPGMLKECIGYTRGNRRQPSPRKAHQLVSHGPPIAPCCTARVTTGQAEPQSTGTPYTSAGRLQPCWATLVRNVRSVARYLGPLSA